MHNIHWVASNQALPEARSSASSGMVAAGFDLSVPRLQEAYSKGIFPWFSEGDPVLWWSPDPRMVLECDNLHVSKNMAKLLRRIYRDEQAQASPSGIYVTTNMAFRRVISQCALPVKNRTSTWINQHIKNVYYQWHLQGQVHSIEVWNGGELAGGLYGVAMCGMFFGESMFSRANNMSKVALFYLVSLLKRLGINYIDCQQETAHLSSLGARTMPRSRFLDLIGCQAENPKLVWGQGQVLQSGVITPFRPHET